MGVKYRVRAFPTLFLIDDKGLIRRRRAGNPGKDRIDAAVEGLVKVASKAR